MPRDEAAAVTLRERLLKVEMTLAQHVKYCSFWQKAVFVAAVTAALTGIVHLFPLH